MKLTGSIRRLAGVEWAGTDTDEPNDLAPGGHNLDRDLAQLPIGESQPIRPDRQ